MRGSPTTEMEFSEGKSFNDDLCRGIITLGIPYENIKSSKQLAMKHIMKEEDYQ